MKGKCMRTCGWVIAAAATLLLMVGLACAAGPKAPSASVAKDAHAVSAKMHAPAAGGLPAMLAKAGLPAKGSVIVKPRNSGYDTCDIYVKDTESGRQIFFMTTLGAYASGSSYVGGYVYVVRSSPSSHYELWRYDASRNGAMLAAGSDLGEYRPSPDNEYVALSVESEGVRILRMNGSGIACTARNRDLVGADAQAERSLYLVGWNRTGTEVWYSVSSTADESGSISEYGCIGVPSCSITTFPVTPPQVGSCPSLLNPDTRRVLYHDCPPLLRGEQEAAMQHFMTTPEAEKYWKVHALTASRDTTVPDVGVWLYDLVTAQDIRIGTMPLGQKLWWQDDSTVSLPDPRSGNRIAVKVAGGQPPSPQLK